MPGFFRLILISVFAWLASRLLMGVVRAFVRPSPSRPSSVPPKEPPRSISERLVRDPVCGLALPESSALQHGEHFFCSSDCRDAFLAERG